MDPGTEIPDDDLEALVRAALEVRRRVKEQQKRVFRSEFRNTRFSYAMGEDGIEKFVSTPELRSDDATDPDPLPPGQVWGIGPGGPETGPSLYRIEVTTGRGAGMRILNAPAAPAFRESVRHAEQNLYARARELVGDRDPRAHEFSVQLRAMDNDRTGAGLGLPALVALCGALLGKSVHGRESRQRDAGPRSEQPSQSDPPGSAAAVVQRDVRASSRPVQRDLRQVASPHAQAPDSPAANTAARALRNTAIRLKDRNETAAQAASVVATRSERARDAVVLEDTAGLFVAGSVKTSFHVPAPVGGARKRALARDGRVVPGDSVAVVPGVQVVDVRERDVGVQLVEIDRNPGISLDDVPAMGAGVVHPDHHAGPSGASAHEARGRVGSDSGRHAVVHPDAFSGSRRRGDFLHREDVVPHPATIAVYVEISPSRRRTGYPSGERNPAVHHHRTDVVIPEKQILDREPNAAHPIDGQGAFGAVALAHYPLGQTRDRSRREQGGVGHLERLVGRLHDGNRHAPRFGPYFFRVGRLRRGTSGELGACFGGVEVPDARAAATAREQGHGETGEDETGSDSWHGAFPCVCVCGCPAAGHEVAPDRDNTTTRTVMSPA